MYLSIDLETGSRTFKKRKASAWANSILCIGLKYQGKTVQSIAKDYVPQNVFKDVNLLIGHNIKFDLLYMWRNDELQSYFREDGQIWDTQLCEYVISGQQHKYPGLRDIAVNKYGAEYRDKKLENYRIGKELDTTLIPIQELLEDVQGDVLDAELVALAQAKQVASEGQKELVKGSMDALLATTEIEANGMYVNKDILLQYKVSYEREINEIDVELRTLIGEVNLRSSQQMSRLFFGGSTEVTESVLIGKYKNGNDKYQNQTKTIEVTGFGLNPKEYSRKMAKDGIYSTDEKVLSTIVQRMAYEANDAEYTEDQIKAYKVAKLLLRTRELNKLVDTYYTPTLELLYDHDSCVHSEFSHCGYERDNTTSGGGTSTGRLSCRNINLQNQPGKPSYVKKHFTSRYKEEGCLVEFDYSQLEVVVFAFLTQDRQLLKDINEGVDVHKVMYANCYNVAQSSVTEAQRKGIKACTFHVIYGGGYKSMAKRMDLNEKFCELFINKFYERYPMAKIWQNNLVRQVEGTKTVTSDRTAKGFTIHSGYYKSITGRKYIFFTTDSPNYLTEKGIMTSFNPPDIKNYPVQGTATADIVLLMIGRVWRRVAIHHRDKFLMVNTVHDSLVLDVQKKHLTFVIDSVRLELEDVQAMMKERFMVDFNIPVKVEHKVGDSWGALE